jgi:hypothetical protein
MDNAHAKQFHLLLFNFNNAVSQNDGAGVNAENDIFFGAQNLKIKGIATKTLRRKVFAKYIIPSDLV